MDKTNTASGNWCSLWFSECIRCFHYSFTILPQSPVSPWGLNWPHWTPRVGLASYIESVMFDRHVRRLRSNSCLEDFLIFFYGFSAPRDPWRGRSVFIHHLAHRLLQREEYHSDRIKSHVCISSGESGLAAVFYLVVTCIIFIWKISEILELFWS